jgi:SUMO ligase MMS21 Smc5/6 complex component
LSGQGIKEQIAAVQAMLDLKDADDPMQEMAVQGIADLNKWSP